MKKIVAVVKQDIKGEDVEFGFPGEQFGESNTDTHFSTPKSIDEIIKDSVQLLSSMPNITQEKLKEVSDLFQKSGIFRGEGTPISVHVDPHSHGHHTHKVAKDFPQAALSLLMNIIDKELIELCLCAPIDLDELGGAVKHAETAAQSISTNSDSSHSHTLLNSPSDADIGLAVGASYFAVFGLYFGYMNVTNGADRLKQLKPYFERVSKIIDSLDTAIGNLDSENPAKKIMTNELDNMKAYLSEIKKSRVEGKAQVASGVTMLGGSGALIGSFFLAELTPFSSIFFALYGALHVGKYSALLARTVAADHTKCDPEIKAALDSFQEGKYNVYSALIGTFTIFTASSVLLTVGAFGGAALVGGPIGLGVASGLLVASALVAAYLNNVSANRFAPKNQDYQSSRLLWGAPENVAARMVACAELRDIAGQFGKAKPGKRHVKVMDHVKCFGYWAGTVATIGVLPKFSSTVRDFKTKYDVSRSLIADQDRQELVARYCDTLIKSNQEEMTSLEGDINTMTEAINHLTDDELSQKVKELLLKQLVLKQLAHDKLQHEVAQAQYIKRSLHSMPGVAYSEFLKLTHMDVAFVETMDVLRKGHKISDEFRTETKLESSEPLKYLGQCSHSHKPEGKHKHKKPKHGKHNGVHPQPMPVHHHGPNCSHPHQSEEKGAQGIPLKPIAPMASLSHPHGDHCAHGCSHSQPSVEGVPDPVALLNEFFWSQMGLAFPPLDLRPELRPELQRKYGFGPSNIPGISESSTDATSRPAPTVSAPAMAHPHLEAPPTAKVNTYVDHSESDCTAHEDHHEHGHHCDHHHHSHEKPYEITYRFADACHSDTEKNRYLAAFDYVVNTNLRKEMDEQWVKRGNHLEAWLLLNR
jgi:hypothetical protein